MKVIGKAIPKLDGLQLVKGQPAYTADFTPTDALVVKVLRSPYAFARIAEIHTEIAEKVPGVVCIFTWKDVPRVPFTRAGQCYPELSAYDTFILDKYVRHVGDHVAIVAAETEEQANKALRLIKVEYDVLDPVLNYESAGIHRNRVHPESDLTTHMDVGCDPETNTACKVSFAVGDMEKVKDHAEIVFTHRYEVQAQVQNMLETQRTWTRLDPYGRLEVVTSTQIPFHVRRILARALDIPAARIRVVKPRIGGGFGSKQTAASEFYPALVTLKTGRPAQIVYTRKEAFESTSTRHKMRFNVTLAADQSGKIRGLDMEGLSDTGAYGEHALTTFGAAGKKVLTLYNKVDALRFDGKAMYTNNSPGGAFRGFGVTQGTFAVESAINELAQRLNMDPVQVRRINHIQQGEEHPLYNLTTKGWGDKPMPMKSCLLSQCIETGAQAFGWTSKPRRRVLPNGKVRGTGMAIAQQGSGLPKIDMAAATLKLEPDGHFTLLTGSTDIGTGSDTVMSQIAAEGLGVPMDAIVIRAADTDNTPYDSGAYASSTTYTTGNAIREATRLMVDKIVEVGALYFDTAVEHVGYAEGVLYNTKSGERCQLQDFASTVLYNRIHQQLSVTGSYVPELVAPPYMAGFAEVEVDPLTGKVDMIEFVGAVDCGRPLNPHLAKIQTEGGIAQGVGLALFEQVTVNEKGQMTSNNLMQYKIPARRDIGRIRAIVLDGHDESGPYGAKSIGEVVINTVAPAITEAIHAALGVRIRTLPATPEKVMMALGNQES